MRRGSSYRAEFKEFFQVFAPFIDLGRLRSMKLLEVNSKVCHLPLDEVTLLRHDSSSDLGGSLRSQSHGKKADVRNDQQLNSAHSNWPDSPKFFCNYEWQICEKLDEPVHTHIYAPEGEVAIYGQVKEKSVRYVLRRIRELA